MDKKKKIKLKDFNDLIGRPAISMIAGLGMIFWFQLFNWNVWPSICFGLLASHFMAKITTRDKEVD